jgi:hypothetical protein
MLDISSHQAPQGVNSLFISVPVTWQKDEIPVLDWLFHSGECCLPVER